jgi:tetratricopeptide (TPR) repeat protein
MSDLEFLIRYLDGDLTEEQKREFQEQLKTNSSLANNLEFIQDMDQLLGDRHMADFEDSLKEVENVLFQKQEKEKSSRKFFLGKVLAIAGVIAILIMGTAYFLFFKSGKLNTDALYSQYYQKLDAGFVNRSEAPGKDDFIQAIQYYDAGKYNQAITLFQKIINSDPSNNAARLFLGICYSETKQYPHAVPLFLGIVKQNDLAFKEHAYWYLSLCYLKLNDIPRAKQNLKILISSQSFYVEKASELLKKLP